MQINSPYWNLNTLCPCCGQGSLLIIACINCGNLAAVCEEVGTFFSEVSVLDASEDHQCKLCRCQKFLAATSDQIEKEGVDSSLYS